MASSSIKSAYWKGFRDGTPFVLVIVPFSTLFGVLATESGLSVFEVMTFSIVVISDTQYYLSENDVVTNPTFDT